MRAHFRTFLLLVLFSHFSSFAQQKEVDSLRIVLSNAKADTTRIDVMLVLADRINLLSADSAVGYDMKAMNLAIKINDSIRLNSSLRSLGWDEYLQGNYPKSLEHLYHALKLSEQQNDKRAITACLGNIANVYRKQHEYRKALANYEKGSIIAEKENNIKGKGNMLANMASVYSDIADSAKRAGNITNAKEHLLRSLDCSLRALKIFEQLGQKKKVAAVLGNIGTVYDELDEREKAWDYYHKALAAREEAGAKNLVSVTLGNMGNMYRKEKRYPESEKILIRAMGIAKEIGYTDQIMQLNKKFSDLYSDWNKPAPALAYHKEYIRLRDSIYNEENVKQSLQTQMTYDYEKKEAATKAENDKLAALAAEENKKQRIVIWSVAFGLLLTVIFAFFVVRSLRNSKKQNQVIESQRAEVMKQKETIEEKNKSITDSINYAQRIQQAKLPELQEIKTAFPQSFILFRPKDIVSGDFYFLRTQGGKHIVAAADCTGHGVPGALMSMVGSEQLNKTTMQSQEPAQILQQLNVGMKRSLRQTSDESSTRDGMDIALCVFDQLDLQYAGANRPIWIFRKSGVLEEIKATKKAIGGHTPDEQVFENHKIKLEKGDTCYIFTDGYADQFGKSGKKLTTKKFRMLLQEIMGLDMLSQERRLASFMDEWKGDTEQIDDILVIGIRV